MSFANDCYKKMMDDEIILLNNKYNIFSKRITVFMFVIIFYNVLFAVPIRYKSKES